MNDKNEQTGAFVLLDFTGDNLEPHPLTSLIPLRTLRPKKKGEPLGPAYKERTPVAKTGYCGFTTSSAITSNDANAHISYVLERIEPIISQIKSIVHSQSLVWDLVLFEGESPGEFVTDVSSEILLRLTKIGLPFRTKETEAFTAVFDPEMGMQTDPNSDAPNPDGIVLPTAVTREEDEPSQRYLGDQS